MKLWVNITWDFTFTLVQRCDIKENCNHHTCYVQKPIHGIQSIMVFIWNTLLLKKNKFLFLYFRIVDLLQMLDISKYSRFNNDPNVKDIDEFLPSDLDNLRLLVDYKYGLLYKEYREVNIFIWFRFITQDRKTLSLKIWFQYNGRAGNNSDDEDYGNFFEYGRLVGKSLSQRLYLVT